MSRARRCDLCNGMHPVRNHDAWVWRESRFLMGTMYRMLTCQDDKVCGLLLCLVLRCLGQPLPVCSCRACLLPAQLHAAEACIPACGILATQHAVAVLRLSHHWRRCGTSRSGRRRWAPCRRTIPTPTATCEPCAAAADKPAERVVQQRNNINLLLLIQSHGSPPTACGRTQLQFQCAVSLKRLPACCCCSVIVKIASPGEPASKGRDRGDTTAAGPRGSRPPGRKKNRRKGRR